MAQQLRIAPPNSLLLLMDSAAEELPEIMDGHGIAATTDCVAIACRAAADGETHVTLGRHPEVTQAGKPSFEGTIRLRSRDLAVRTVLDEPVLSLHVDQSEVVIRIWTDDPREPEKVVISVE